MSEIMGILECAVAAAYRCEAISYRELQKAANSVRELEKRLAAAEARCEALLGANERMAITTDECRRLLRECLLNEASALMSGRWRRETRAITDEAAKAGCGE